MRIYETLELKDLKESIQAFWDISGQKILEIEKHWDPKKGTPVFTEAGVYTSRGWTEWTQGFQYGSALLQYEATADERFLEIGRSQTLEKMMSHVTHMGVHDHGFNNISTYGNLWRLMKRGKIPYCKSSKVFGHLCLV